MLNCRLGACGLAVADGEAVEVIVAVGTVVAVAEPVTWGKIPLPHPELGSIAKVNATIIRMGRKRAILATLPRPRAAPPALRLIGEVGGLIFRLGTLT